MSLMVTRAVDGSQGRPVARMPRLEPEVLGTLGDVVLGQRMLTALVVSVPLKVTVPLVTV